MHEIVGHMRQKNSYNFAWPVNWALENSKRTKESMHLPTVTLNDRNQQQKQKEKCGFRFPFRIQKHHKITGYLSSQTRLINDSSLLTIDAFFLSQSVLPFGKLENTKVPFWLIRLLTLISIGIVKGLQLNVGISSIGIATGLKLTVRII